MLAQVAGKFKAFNAALARPLVATAEKFRLQGKDASPAGTAARFEARFTRSRRDIVKAQRLRYRVFSEAYGATFKAPFGLDRDQYDKHCLHLIVRDTQTAEIVGYTRVLPDSRIHRTGGFYSAGEFHMGMVHRLDGTVAEIGRTCIHPDYRGGAVITTLWSCLAEYMLQENIRYLVGCASVSLAEGYDVGAICARVRERHLSDAAMRVHPKLPMSGLSRPMHADKVRMPPLLKAYLRMGASVCGEPCWDPDFNCLDFFILLAVEDLPARYVQHFLQPTQPVLLAAS